MGNELRWYALFGVVQPDKYSATLAKIGRKTRVVYAVTGNLLACND